MKTVFSQKLSSVLICNSVCLILLTFAGLQKLFSQTKVESNRYEASREFIPASPTASLFSIFGHTPVSHFTGSPQIEVPLHRIEYKDLGLDLNLMYHSSMGNRPDILPGPVGNGWLFSFGGVITRISKGVRPADFPNPASVPTSYNPTSSSTWSSNVSMEGYIDNAKVFVDPGCRYDEYSYNFCGMSGKFYKDHNDVQRFKSAQGESLVLQSVTQTQHTIPLVTEPQGPATPYSIMEDYRPSLIQKDYVQLFTITDSRGFKYMFGLADEAIEFSRPGMNASNFDLLEQNTIPTTWYLTSISSPNGYSIKFHYRRGQFYVTSESYCDGMTMMHSNITGLSEPASAKEIRSTIIHPSYLDSITTPNGGIKFYWSLADKQLKYKYNPSPSVTDPLFPMYFMKYVDIKDASMDNRFPDKLDSFKVFINKSLKKSVQFNFTNDTTTRLKLLSVSIKGNSPTKNGFDFWQFQYDTTPLPGYLAFKSDKYGFYNGRNDYITSGDPNYYSGLFTDSSDLAGYLASREPDTNYSRAEVLTKVIYPTGGYSEFEYENHDYSRKATFWPIGIAQNPGNTTKITGGLRIKRIRTFDATNHKAAEKRYFYKKDFATGGTTSSGVLNYEPIFQESFSGNVTAPANKSASASNYEGYLTYNRWSTDPIYAASYNKGSHITYSEVTEMNLDSSYTVYKYNNYDNGFHDKPAENMVCDNSNVASFYKEDDANSMELERGNLKAELSYTNTNQPVRKIEYLYDTSTARLNDNVRVLKAIPNPIFSANFPSLRYLATLQYTYFPYLLQKKQVDYTVSNDSIITVENYAYDTQNRLLKEKNILLSNNREKRIINRYPADMVALGQTTPYATMMSKHIVGSTIETEERIDTTLLTITSTPYLQGLSPNTNIIAPALSKMQYKYLAPETRIVYHKYDSAGNLLYQSQDGINRICYLYSYGRLYPIAKVLNASYDTVQSILTAKSIDSFSILPSPTLSQVNTFINRLRNNTRMNKAMITSYTYDPVFGLTSETDINGKTTYYEYDHLGRLNLVRDKDQNIIRAICYDYAGQQTDCQFARLGATTEFYYATTLNGICGSYPYPPQTSLPKVTAYFQTFIPGIDTSMIYYKNQQYTEGLNEGFYEEVGGTSRTIHYIREGKIVFTGTCGSILWPVLAKYSVSTSNICTGSFPDRPIFFKSADRYNVGSAWYADSTTSIPVTNGYYLINNKYYQLSSGVVVSVTNCNPVFTKLVRRDNYFQEVCDMNTLEAYQVYYQGAFAIGTTLYTNTAMTTPLRNGHFSDGNIVFTTTSSGTIMRLMNCSQVGSIPPEQMPGPIF